MIPITRLLGVAGALTQAPARRAPCTSPPGAQSCPGPLQGRNARRHGVAFASPTPDLGGCSSVRQGPLPVRRGAARRRRSGWDALADSAACSWCVRGPGTLGRRGAARGAPPCTGRRCRLDTITRRLLVELNDSGCADRGICRQLAASAAVLGCSSTTLRRSSSRSASPVLRGQLGRHGARLGGRTSAAARCSERRNRRSGPVTASGRRGYRNRG